MGVTANPIYPSLLLLLLSLYRNSAITVELISFIFYGYMLTVGRCGLRRSNKMRNNFVLNKCVIMSMQRVSIADVQYGNIT